MAPVLDATLAGASSNSYVDLAGAEAIAANIPSGDEWVALAEDVKINSLISATFWLETLDYRGQVCTGTQRLKWPRSGQDCQGRPLTCSAIPYKIQEAEVLLAMAYGKDPSSFPDLISGGGNSTPAGTYVSNQTLGDLSISYAQYSNNVNTNCDDCDKTPILQAFPWLEAVLGCLADIPVAGLGRIIGRQRS